MATINFIGLISMHNNTFKFDKTLCIILYAGRDKIINIKNTKGIYKTLLKSLCKITYNKEK